MCFLMLQQYDAKPVYLQVHVESCVNHDQKIACSCRVTKLSPGNMCPEQIFHGRVLHNNCGVVKSHEGRVVLFVDERRETSRN